MPPEAEVDPDLQEATMQHTTTSSTNQGSGNALTMSECISRCLDCYRVCRETAASCLAKGGKHANVDHIRLLQDCAEICRTSADFMIRGSEHHHVTCGACAEICEACAVSCESMGNDAEMKRCADVCRRCAESCRAMAGAH